MPTEVLVMCPVCARPQPVARACVHCGAAIPEVPRPAGLPSAEDLAPDSARAPPADLELELGEGRRLFLGRELLELRMIGSAPEQLALADLRRVRLVKRRPWAAVIAMEATVLLAAALVPSWPLRVLLLAVIPVAGWFLLRRETLAASFERVNGEARQVPLGGRLQTARNCWLELSEELRRRGVEVGP